MIFSRKALCSIASVTEFDKKTTDFAAEFEVFITKFQDEVCNVIQKASEKYNGYLQLSQQAEQLSESARSRQQSLQASAASINSQISSLSSKENKDDKTNNQISSLRAQRDRLMSESNHYGAVARKLDEESSACNRKAELARSSLKTIEDSYSACIDIFRSINSANYTAIDSLKAVLLALSDYASLTIE